MISLWLRFGIIASTVFGCVNFFDINAKCDDQATSENLQTVVDKIFQAREFWDESVPHLKDGNTLEGRKVLFVTHASLFFDDGSIASAVNKRVHEALKKGDPIVCVVQNDSPIVLQNYFLTYRPNFLLVSRDGSHGVRLKTEVVQVAGGGFYACAARTASNAIALSENGEKAIRIELLTDSLYSGGTSMDKYLKNLTDNEMLDFIGKTYLPSVLEYQPDPDRPKPTLDDQKFKILRDGQLIGVFGTGNRIVEMNFLIKEEIVSSQDTQSEHAQPQVENDCRIQALNGTYYLYRGTSLVGSFNKPTKALKSKNLLVSNGDCKNQSPTVECRVATNQGYYFVYQGISQAGIFNDPLEAVGLRNLLASNNLCKAQTPIAKCRILKTEPQFKNDEIFYELHVGDDMGSVVRSYKKTATQVRDFLVDEKVCVKSR